MAESRRKFDHDFREGAVRIVRETGKPIAQVARELGVNEGALGNWVNTDRRRRGEGNGALGEDERAELARLRKENAELAMERESGVGRAQTVVSGSRRIGRYGAAISERPSPARISASYAPSSASRIDSTASKGARSAPSRWCRPARNPGEL